MPAPAAGVSVRVEGAEGLTLLRDGQRFRPPTIPPGSYTVLAVFDGAEVPAGQVTLPATGEVVIACQAMMRRCALR